MEASARLMTILLAAAVLAWSVPASAQSDPLEYDIVVYGDSSGGVAAAVGAARMGKRVALVSPGSYVGTNPDGSSRYISTLGGMTSGGLSHTDGGDSSITGGVAGDFYERAGSSGFTPSAAEGMFENLVDESGVDVFRYERLDRTGGVVRENGRITEIRMETGDYSSTGTGGNGLTFRAGMFIDGTYEGDLMAAAGVSYTVGREAASTYGESFNGVGSTVGLQISPYRVPGDPSSGLLPGVSVRDPESLVQGSADDRVQAYNYRLHMTGATDRLPWTKPANYDEFVSVGGLDVFTRHVARRVANGETLTVDSILAGRSGGDYNNLGNVSSDVVGRNHDYPDADYTQREEIVQTHIDYTRAMLYWMATDPDSPQSLKDSMARIGLSPDEFTDNGGFPDELYVREARRMVGQYVMTEADIRREDSDPDALSDSIGRGSYAMDSHHMDRFVTDPTDPDATLRQEQGFFVGHDNTGDGYRIAYGAIVPAEGEAENLLVPVTCSASHVAYGSMRMEPVFMILGHSAGTAAVLALDEGVSVQDLDAQELRKRLLQQGQILDMPDQTAPAADEPFVGRLAEEFNYGSNVEQRLDQISWMDQATGWTDAWEDPYHAPKYDGSKNLTYDAPGYTNAEPLNPVQASGSATTSEFTRDGRATIRRIYGGMEGEIWVSALLQVETGNQAMIWLDGTNDEEGPSSYVGIDDTGRLVLHHNGTVQTAGAVSAYNDGLTHLLLAKVGLDEDGVEDSLSLWLDPDLLALGNADLSLTGEDLYGDLFDGIGISVDSTGGWIDALRLSNTGSAFEDVTIVPDPATVLLLGGGGLLLLGRRYRK